MTNIMTIAAVANRCNDNHRQQKTDCDICHKINDTSICLVNRDTRGHDFTHHGVFSKAHISEYLARILIQMERSNASARGLRDTASL